MKHYPLLYRANGRNGYLIWSTDLDGDAADMIELDAQRLLRSFTDLRSLQEFAIANGLEIVCERSPKRHDIDAAVDWADNPVATSSDCENALDVWNLFGDVAATVPERSAQISALMEQSLRVYEMLFYGSNLPSITPPGKQYIPNWTSDDTTQLRNVLSSGANLFRSLLAHHNVA